MNTFKDKLFDFFLFPGPMDCVEAIAAYGNKSATFDLHWAKGSINIRCIPVMNGAKFYFLPITPSVNVSQPWVDGSFEQIFEYDYAMEVMRHFIQRASSCRQTISYSCMLAKITGNSRPCDKDRNNWQVGCEGASCNCDDDSQRIMKYDKQHFVDRNKLPLGRIIINSVSRINSSLTYTVGPVECFQGKILPSFRQIRLVAKGLPGGKAPRAPKSDSVPPLEIEYWNISCITLHYLLKINTNHVIQCILKTTEDYQAAQLIYTSYTQINCANNKIILATGLP